MTGFPVVLFPIVHERNPEAGVYEYLIAHDVRRYSCERWGSS